MNEELEQEKLNIKNERMRRLKESEDWRWAKEELEKMITDYLSLATVPEYKTATSLMNEISTRKKAAGVVRAWIEEVEGSGTQQQYNVTKKIIKNEMILNEESQGE